MYFSKVCELCFWSMIHYLSSKRNVFNLYLNKKNIPWPAFIHSFA